MNWKGDWEFAPSLFVFAPNMMWQWSEGKNGSNRIIRAPVVGWGWERLHGLYAKKIFTAQFELIVSASHTCGLSYNRKTIVHLVSRHGYCASSKNNSLFLLIVPFKILRPRVSKSVRPIPFSSSHLSRVASEFQCHHFALDTENCGNQWSETFHALRLLTR